LTVAIELPSCDADVDAHCVGEDADLSAEGIQKCLESLETRSDRCSAYLALMAGCAADIGEGGPCQAAHGDGEAVPCLVQRVAPDQLTPECVAVLPKNEVKGLDKFWAKGKRKLLIDELVELSDDEKDTYHRWLKRKGARKTDKDKERDYAVKTAKKEKTIHLVTAEVATALGEIDEMSMEKATELVTGALKAAIDEDMTGTLKPFAKSEIAGIAKAALAKSRAMKAEL